MQKTSLGLILHHTQYKIQNIKSEVWESLSVIHDRTNIIRAESYMAFYYFGDWIKSEILKFALDYVSNSFMPSSSFPFIDKISSLLVSSIEKSFEEIFFSSFKRLILLSLP